MDKFRQIKTNITIQSDSGTRQTQKQRNLHLASYSSSNTTGISFPSDARLTSGLSGCFNERVTGAPMKKLLAEEMVKETETKRHQPSIIAKLMGFDGFPSQQIDHKQKKGSVKTDRYKVSILESHRNAISHERYNRKKSSNGKKKFKDVFEVVEVAKVESGRIPFQCENSRHVKAKIELVRQKFIDSKCLSIDDRLQNSKEFYDALEVLDSNTDLLMNLLPELDSLYKKDPHYLKGSPRQCHNTGIDAVRFGNTIRHKKKLNESKRARKPLWMDDNRHDVHSPLKSKVKPEGNYIDNMLPTRIVVLKPNIGKLPNVIKPVSSPHSSLSNFSDNRQHLNFLSTKHRGVEMWENRNLCNDFRPSRYKSREYREIAKEITRQVSNDFSRCSINLSPSYNRGYTGDESSCSISENDFTNDSDVATVVSINSYNPDNLIRPSSSHSSVTSMNIEARNRLLERLKINRRSVDVGKINNGSTMGETLSTPDSKRLDSIFGHGDSRVNAEIGDLFRSKSISPSSPGFISPKPRMGRKSIIDDKSVNPKEILNEGRNKSVQMNYNYQESPSCQNSRPGSYMVRSECHSFRKSDSALRNSYCAEDKIHNGYEDKSLYEHKHVGPDMLGSMVTHVGREITILPSEFPDNLLQENSDCVKVEVMLSCNVDDFAVQEPSVEPSEEGPVMLDYPIPEAESLARCKESDQPSPIYVLEPSFVEEASTGSECFERVSADLQGLRMQLQLLKIESEPCPEGLMTILSDEDNEIPVDIESWESSYLIDVLNLCDFENNNIYFSLHQPVSPFVFERLENKYRDTSNCMVSERRLLFDRIDSAIVEILQNSMGPWVRTVGRAEVESELRKVFEVQERNSGRDCEAEKLLGNQSQWMNVVNDIQQIGMEIERLLVDELVMEGVVWLRDLADELA